MPAERRIEIVDVFRGFALLCIIIGSSYEYHNFFKQTESHQIFSKDSGDLIAREVFFFFYVIGFLFFSLTLGFSFIIQSNKKKETETDYKGKLWRRLAILLIIGILHSLVYKADIIHIFAISGFIMLLFYRLSTKTLIPVIILLLFQIHIIYSIISSFLTKDFQYLNIFEPGLSIETNLIETKGSFFEMLYLNLWKAKVLIWYWIFNNGIYLQHIAFLILGLILGRNDFFKKTEKHSGLLVKILIMCALLFMLFWFVQKSILISDFSETQKKLITLLIQSWIILTIVIILFCLIILTGSKFNFNLIFKFIADFGKLRLTNYIIYAGFSVFIFSGFGLEMYKNISHGFSLIFVISSAIVQIILSRIWMNNFNYGPIEWLIDAFTHFNFKIKFRKEKNIDLLTSL